MQILLLGKYRDLVMSSTVSVAGLLGLLYTESSFASTNQAPVALAQTVTTKEDTKKSITLRGTDPERKKLTYVIVSQPKHGTVTLSNNKVTYIPNTDYFGQDTFSFKVNDGELDSTLASVSLTITPVNDKPVAENGSANAFRNTGQEITLKATDVDGDPLTYLPAKKSKKGGIVTVKTGNTVIYTPKKDYVGTDSFTFAAQDNKKGKSTTATVNVTVANAPVNQPPTANAGSDQEVFSGAEVTLQGNGSDPDNDPLTYSWTQTSGTPTVSLTGVDTATARFTAPTLTSDTTLKFALVVNDGHGGTAADSLSVLVRDVTVEPTPTGKLNDTGITQCGNAGSNGACPQTGFLQQDAETGRDASQATNNDADGYRGFSFTKISSTGAALPAAASSWSCVKDNVTGLIWEVKTDDGGLHDKDWTYSWYDINTVINGGATGFANGGICGETSQCDTGGYVAAVNAVGWCGATDWRMPTVDELQSIVDMSRNNPAIDAAYFPNTVSSFYWSGTLNVSNTSAIWGVYFDRG